jgi:hypothetical protein
LGEVLSVFLLLLVVALPEEARDKAPKRMIEKIATTMASFMRPSVAVAASVAAVLTLRSLEGLVLADFAIVVSG